MNIVHYFWYCLILRQNRTSSRTLPNRGKHYTMRAAQGILFPEGGMTLLPTNRNSRWHNQEARDHEASSQLLHTVFFTKKKFCFQPYVSSFKERYSSIFTKYNNLLLAHSLSLSLVLCFWWSYQLSPWHRIALIW